MKTCLTSLLLLSLAMFQTSCGTADNSSKAPDAAESSAAAVEHVDAVKAAGLLATNDEVVVLDIRTPEEFSQGHIKDARNVDFYEDDFEANLAKLDRDQTYLVHCASGGRSGKSLEAFERLGFKSIVHLDGGYRAWVDAGQSVETATE